MVGFLFLSLPGGWSFDRNQGAGILAGITVFVREFNRDPSGPLVAAAIRVDGLEAHVIVVQVSVRAKPEQAEELEQILREVVGEARQLEGCMRYEWYRSPDVACEVFVYAEFDSEEAFADYRRGPVVKKIGDRLIPLLDAPPSYTHFRATVLQQG